LLLSVCKETIEIIAYDYGKSLQPSADSVFRLVTERVVWCYYVNNQSISQLSGLHLCSCAVV